MYRSNNSILLQNTFIGDHKCNAHDSAQRQTTTPRTNTPTLRRKPTN